MGEPLNIDEIRDAVRRVTSALIAVSPYLNKPYRDSPHTTPWDRFIHPRLSNLRHAVGLEASPDWVSPVTSDPHGLGDGPLIDATPADGQAT